MIDLNAMAMFLSAVKSRSLTAAAEQADIPLATLSRKIRKLEQELNLQLIERSAKGIELTEVGSRLYEYGSRGLEILLDAEKNIHHDQALLKGRLRISIPPSFEPWWDLLHAFQTQYPDIILSVYSTERRVDLIHDGIDVALRIGPIVDESMVARHLLNYQHQLVAAPALLAKHGPILTTEDLHRFPCAVWSSDTSNPNNFWMLQGQKIYPNIVFSTNDYLHLKKLVLIGSVIAELPPFLTIDEIANGNLCTVLDPLPAQEINLIYPSHKHPSTIIRTYLDFCQKHAPSLLMGVKK